VAEENYWLQVLLGLIPDERRWPHQSINLMTSDPEDISSNLPCIKGHFGFYCLMPSQSLDTSCCFISRLGIFFEHFRSHRKQEMLNKLHSDLHYMFLPSSAFFT